MTTTINNLFHPIFLQWLESGITPESAIEGVAPEFANLLQVQAEQFTFDSLFHNDQMPDWAWNVIEFNEVFDGQFFFYLPITWSESRQQGLNVVFGDTKSIRQSIFLTKKSLWQPSISKFLQGVKVVAFAYYPLHKPNYDQWVFVTEDNETGTMWTFAVYSSGDYLVAVKADAPTTSELNQQLTSVINSNPWYGWIESATKQLR
ncbi:hypothetical protein [Nostoc sp. MS1]|uniref:hypothetical protein n=1 Tax=Nostoc sp. MS1 TaxID=2764711 RepID=UPI001CC6628C|nr:hypothetical protein [Nostoc sp. MS1]BCL39716.1 hypothetical protein NSMS1_61630 [Nostoc sp. MS1]